MVNKTYIIIISLLFFSCNTLKDKTDEVNNSDNQAGDSILEWSKEYNLSRFDEPRCIQQTNDNGLIITGLTQNIINSERFGYVLLMKLNMSGDTVWVKQFGEKGYNEGYHVIQTKDNGYAITGSSDQDSQKKMLIIKTDDVGKVLWRKTYSKGNETGGKHIQQTKDGGYIATGYTFGNASTDMFLVKTDLNGDTLWTRQYGDLYADGGNFVKQTSDKGFMVVGSTTKKKYAGSSYGFIKTDAYVIKTDAFGKIEWSDNYGDVGPESGSKMLELKEGGYLISGGQEKYISNYHTYLIRMKPNGDTLWTKSMEPAGAISSVVSEGKDGNFIINSIIQDKYYFSDIHTVCLAADGNVLWSKPVGIKKHFTGLSVLRTDDNSFVIAGKRWVKDAEIYNMVVVKTKPKED